MQSTSVGHRLIDTVLLGIVYTVPYLTSKASEVIKFGKINPRSIWSTPYTILITQSFIATQVHPISYVQKLQQQQRPYNVRRHKQIVAYCSPPSSKLAPNILSRPHVMHPNLQKLSIDPPILLLLIVCIVALLLWLSYGTYMVVTWYILRLRAVKYGLEDNTNRDIIMAKLDGTTYSSEENGSRRFGQAAKWSHPSPTKTGDDKLEHAWAGKIADLSRHQSVSSGNACAVLGNGCKRSPSLGGRRRSAV
ncbi:hypothetical protein BOTNAR_0472g00020 [Botryotinia narcissicola]|uniref:Uncharacterized protein n=1 Tax=Botryotinia narcissicola TaxID=278944 RepID=A0A4Z1HHV3_9HELO|nr:hypothetical protein BOTNAR_0472g00020 [Botryotinia narcissicola]